MQAHGSRTERQSGRPRRPDCSHTRLPEARQRPRADHACESRVARHLQWHDEDAFGNPDDIIWFTPHRLWISSANFTSRSRLSLEFGFWTEDSSLVERAEQFLVTAMRYSEGLEPESDWFAPDLAPLEYDDEAFRDVLAEMRWDEGDDLRCQSRLPRSTSRPVSRAEPPSDFRLGT